MDDITKPGAAQIAPINAFRDVEVEHLGHKHPLLLLAPGQKKPGILVAGGGWRDDPYWRKHPPMDAELLRGVKQLVAVNMGLRLGVHPALPAGEFLGFLDLDVIDPKLKAAVMPLVMKAAGGKGRAFWRNGNPAKAGGVFLRVRIKDAGAVLRKRELVFGGPDREKIELLSEGQQVAIAGPHPLGCLYAFTNPEKRLPQCPVSEIICLDEDELDALWQELEAIALEAGRSVVSRSGGVSASAGTCHAVFPMLNLEDATLLQEALAEAAPRNDLERGTWVMTVLCYRACCEDVFDGEEIFKHLLAFEEGSPNGTDGGTALTAVLEQTDLPAGFGMWQLAEMLAARVSDDTAAALRAMTRRALAQHAFGSSPLDEAEIEAMSQRTAQALAPKWLRETNARYAFVAGEGTSSSQCVLRFRGNGKWSLDNYHTVTKLHANDLVVVGEHANGAPMLKNRIEAWLKHPLRRAYPEGIRFMFRQPGEADGFFNSWCGWGVEPTPGSCDLTVAHICDVLCNGDAKAGEYTLDFLAAVVQRLGPMGSVIVFRGKPGTGKGWLSRMLRTMLGSAATTTAKGEYVTGKFNLHLRDLRLLICEEAFFSADPSIRGLLKSLITDDKFTGEGKGLPSIELENNLAMIWFTNENWAAPAEANDRRYCVIETGDARDAAYYETLFTRGSAEAPAFLDYLLTRDISNFRVQDFPKTAARDDQIVQGVVGLDQFLFQMLVRGGWPKSVTRDAPEFDLFKDWETQSILVPKDSLRGALTAFSRQDRHGRYVADKPVKDRLEALGCQSIRPSVDGKPGARCWRFPTLENARQNFAAILGLSGQGVWADGGEVIEPAAPVDEDEI